jgi:hypothetical protein
MCSTIAKNKSKYGIIVRSILKVPKQGRIEWQERFGHKMPTVFKILKINNLEPIEDFPLKAGYAWMVPNMVKRSIKDGSLVMCAALKMNSNVELSSCYIVERRFATDEEEIFISSCVTGNQSDDQFGETKNPESKDIILFRNYKFSNIVAIGTPEDINKKV